MSGKGWSSPAWLYCRLRAMEPAEVGVRLWRVAREGAWRATRKLPIPLDDANGNGHALASAPAPPAAPRPVIPLDPAATKVLVDFADRLAAGEDLFMGWGWHQVGSPPNWWRDPVTGLVAPDGYGPALDYRDPRIFGEARRIWEMSRHHRWVALAWAHRVTGSATFAAALDREILDWSRRNPFPAGPNWGSALEAALRLVSWREILRSAGPALAPASHRCLRTAAYWSTHFLRSHRSVGSSANNHAVGEAMGLVVSADTWPDLTDAARARDAGWRILARTVPPLTDDQGWPLEQSRDYGSFLLELLLAALDSPSASGRDEARIVQRTAAALTQCLLDFDRLGEAMIIGDGDEGKTLPAPDPASHRDAVLSRAAACTLNVHRPAHTDWGRVVLASLGIDAAALKPDSVEPVSSRLYAGGGTAVLAGRRLRAMVDVGPLGFGSIAAHAHADTLQVLVWLDGKAMLIDPGMPTFFENPAARDRFRATSVHNTLNINGQDQSQVLGPFLWGRRATIARRDWTCGAGTARIAASHDGYQGAPLAATHRRSVTLKPAGDGGESIEVLDAVEAQDSVQFEVVWQLHPRCVIAPVPGVAPGAPPEWLVTRDASRLRVRLHTGGALASVEQGEVSMRFGQVEPAPRLVVRGAGRGEVCKSVVSVVSMSKLEGEE